MKKKGSSPLVFQSVTDGKQIHEKIADQLKDAIFEKKILPGERFPPERELAAIFNTSRVTVRSAILTLKNAGLINVKQGTAGGAFVSTDIGESDISRRLEDIIKLKEISIENVIEVREIIEPQVAYLAARNGTDEDISTIWATIVELERFFVVKKKFKSHDESFHRALAAAANNPLLSVFQSAMIDVLFKFLYDIMWEDEHKKSILSQHRSIAEKVEKRDAAGARQAMKDHLKDMRRILSLSPIKKSSMAWIGKSRKTG